MFRLALVFASLALLSEAAYSPFVLLHPASQLSLALRQCGHTPYVAPATTGTGEFLWHIGKGLAGRGVSLRAISSFPRYLCSVSTNVSSTGLALLESPSNATECTFEDVSGLSHQDLVSFRQGAAYLSLGDLSSAPSCSADASASLVLTDSPSSPSAATWYPFSAQQIKLFNSRASTSLLLRHCYFDGYISPDDGSGDCVWNAIAPADSLVSDNVTDAESLALQPRDYTGMLLGVSATSPNRVGAVDCTANPEMCYLELRDPLSGTEGLISLYHPHTGGFVSATESPSRCTWLGTGSADAVFANESAVVSNSGEWNVTFIGSLPVIEDIPDYTTDNYTSTVGNVSIVSSSQIISLHSAIDDRLAIRVCSQKLYVSNVTKNNNEGFIWQLTSSLDGQAYPQVSLRPLGDLDRYLCSDSTGALVVQLPPTANMSACSFQVTDGLAGSDYISIKQGNAFLSLSQALTGPCASSASGSVILATTPASDAAASWLLNTKTQSVRLCNDNTSSCIYQCNYLGYCVPNDGTNDFRWNIVEPFNKSLGANAISLQSFLYQDLYLSPDDEFTTSPRRLSSLDYCTEQPEKCTFLLVAALDGKVGAFSLYHPSSKRYVGIDNVVDSACKVFKSPANNLILATRQYHDLSTLSWSFTYAGTWPRPLSAESSGSDDFPQFIDLELQCTNVSSTGRDSSGYSNGESSFGASSSRLAGGSIAGESSIEKPVSAGIIERSPTLLLLLLFISVWTH